MSLRLARFKQPMSVVARDRRAKRREAGKRFRFSHINPNGDAVFVRSKTGERYTQSEIAKFFGINLPVPKRLKEKAAKRRKAAKKSETLKMRAAMLGFSI